METNAKSPHHEAKCTFFQPDRCNQFLREGQYGLVRASTKHLGALAKASGCRFRSWRNSHDSGLVDKSSFDRVRLVGQRKLDVCTLDCQQRRSMILSCCQSEKGSGISKSNREEREQALFLTKTAVENTSRTNEPMRKYGSDRKTVCTSWT